MTQRTWVDEALRGTITTALVLCLVLVSAWGYLQHQKKVKELIAERDLYEGMVAEAVEMITEEQPQIALERDSGDVYLRMFGRLYQFNQVCRPEMGM